MPKQIQKTPEINWQVVFNAIKDYLVEQGFDARLRHRMVRIDKIVVYFQDSERDFIAVGHESCTDPTFFVDIADPDSLDQIVSLVKRGEGLKVVNKRYNISPSVQE